jgi:hypothetical protein
MEVMDAGDGGGGDSGVDGGSSIDSGDGDGSGSSRVERGMVMEVATEVGAVIAMPMEVVLTEMVSVRVLPVIVVPVTVMPMIKVGQGCRCHE